MQRPDFHFHKERHPSLMRFIHRLQLRIATEPKQFVLYCCLRFLVIVTMVWCFLLGQYENVALCLLALVLFLVPAFAEENFKLRIPALFESIIYLFIYAAAILGEIQRYYVLIPGWDTMLHTMNGFLCAAVGFSLIDLFNRNSARIHLSPLYVVIAAFCFSMNVGVLWEFCEFFVDIFFYADMQNDTVVRTIGTLALNTDSAQKALKIANITRTVIYTADGSTYTINGGYLDIGIIDTMKDLFVNMIGAIAFSIIGYNYIVDHPANSLAPALEIRPETPEETEAIRLHVNELEKLAVHKHGPSFLSAVLKTGFQRLGQRWPDTARRLQAYYESRRGESSSTVTAWAAILLAAAEFILLYPLGSIFLDVTLILITLAMIGGLSALLFAPARSHRLKGLWVWTLLSCLLAHIVLYKTLQKPSITYADTELCLLELLADLGTPVLLWHLINKEGVLRKH